MKSLARTSLLAVGVIISFQNCGRSFLELDFGKKQSFLAQRSVFGYAASYYASNPQSSIPQSTTASASDSPVSEPMTSPDSVYVPPARTPVDQGPPLSNEPFDIPDYETDVPVKFFCSNQLSDTHQTLDQRPDVMVVLTNDAGVACQFNGAGFRQHLLATKKVPLSMLSMGCPYLPAGQYRLALRAGINYMKLMVNSERASITRNNEIFYAFKGDAGVSYPVTKSSTGTWTGKKVTRQAYVASPEEAKAFVSPFGWNPAREAATATAGLASRSEESMDTLWVLAHPNNGAYADCDILHSPLVIQMGGDYKNPEPMKLSSTQDGVLFDLLGANSTPAPYSPKRIGWHRSLDYYYLVLPNDKGEVNGINELFGDNTLGPDGKFAPTGYHALAKYDGTSADGRTRIAPADNIINARDPIFSRLLLWQDKNFNGKAEPGELYTLAKKQIALIDLKYDPNYSERDQYGNETKYKSIVQTNDGKMHLIFDIWFKYHDL